MLTGGVDSGVGGEVGGGVGGLSWRDLDRVPWELVERFKEKSAAATADVSKTMGGLSDEEFRALARAKIEEAITSWNLDRASIGKSRLDGVARELIVDAVYAEQFGLGRLEPYLADQRVENIEITGNERVAVKLDDGTIDYGPPIAASDEELITFLADLPRRVGQDHREFGPGNNHLDLSLNDPGQSRLAASAWVSHRPVVTIRMHRLRDVDLTDMVARKMLDEFTAAYLRAAVRARQNIVVVGPPNAGKTSLLRAMCNEIHPEEKLVTIESEYELLLHLMPHRHVPTSIIAYEARKGTSEIVAGARAGATSMDELLVIALRQNPSRIIVGEVRGNELKAMLRAMAAGTGSLSTLHATSTWDAVETLVTLNHEGDLGYRRVAQHIDLVVVIGLDGDPNSGGPVERYVTEIGEIRGMGEGGRPEVEKVFAPDPVTRRAKPHMPPAKVTLEQIGAAAGSGTGTGGGTVVWPHRPPWVHQ